MHIIKHFMTVSRHRHAVIRHCAKAGILYRGLLHDLSKYSPVEFINGAKYWQGTRSPNSREREVKGYSEAWLHHKGRNRHHFEYWCDYNPVKKAVCPVKMPLIYVAEMFCDRVAACKIYRGKDYRDSDSLDYFQNSKGHLSIHPETGAFLEKLLKMLSENGEDETFAYLKNYLRNNKDY